MMELGKEILAKIIEYDNIMIHTHINPDMDATGSQVGLYLALKLSFPEKKIYLAGDKAYNIKYSKYFHLISDLAFNNSLSIVTDASTKSFVQDQRAFSSDYLIEIDHHVNNEPFGDIYYVDETSISSCQIIYMLLEEWHLPLNYHIAELLMIGIIGDSGRFLYQGVSSTTFYVASQLMKYNIKLDKIYENMYKDSIDFVRYKGHVLSNFIINNKKIAYMKNYKNDIKSSNLTTNTVSRGMVNSMANLEGVEIWVNFTENENGKIIAELRSKRISVNTVAIDFGGGGHKLASGAILDNWDTAQDMLKVLSTLT